MLSDMHAVRDDADLRNAAEFPCPECGRRLHRIDHSPFEDFHLLYCDGCPRMAEVGHGDAGYAEIRHAHPGAEHAKLMSVVAERLRPCDCGGRFRADAPRRCPFCATTVVTRDAAGVDVTPAWSDDASVDDTEAVTAALTRRTDLWSD
ncbi:hypothetical protein LX16_3319 [Stackebrandtia albiflava]|uniref:Uncharacterized protein n=2 Tax=Stackebrandtia albiflava TaxID=406432 RepID=A0A562V3T3_9ACTN|nr:hypothetical protein LX16_3319 [Stackebrandtia albiflava]